MLTISTFENSKNNSKKEDKKEIVIPERSEGPAFFLRPAK